MAQRALHLLWDWLDRRSALTQWLIAIGLTLVIAQLIRPLMQQLPLYVGVTFTLTILFGSWIIVAYYSPSEATHEGRLTTAKIRE